MPTIVVHHDLPIADATTGRRADLSVVDADSPGAVREVLPDADGLVTSPTNWTDGFLDGLSAGDWVQATSTGYAAFPVDAFEAREVTFTNATGNYGPVVSEHAFALALALSRGLPAFLDRQRRGEWDRDVGSSLTDWHGGTLTVYGLGDVGDAVARRGLAFGMEVYGVKRDPAGYDGPLDPERVVAPDGFRALVPETDLLVLTVPLTDETEGLVDRAVLRDLPDGAVLVNVARGPVVDEDALVDALESGELAGAGLDVFDEEPLPADSPLWGFDDVVVTPHVGGRSASFVGRFVDLFLDNYDRWVAGESLRNEIVPPETA